MKNESPWFQRVKACTFGENVDGVSGSQAVMSSCWARGETRYDNPPNASLYPV